MQKAIVMSNSFKKTYTLSYEAIDEISGKIQEFCKGLGMDSKEIARNRLSAEDYLLDWYEEVKHFEQNGNASPETVPEAPGPELSRDDDGASQDEDELARDEIRTAAGNMNTNQREKDEGYTLEEISKVTLVTGKSFGKYFFRIEKKGESLKPGINFKEAGTFSESVLVGLDLKPEYSYRNRTRHLTFHVRKKSKNQLIIIGQVILAAIVTGLLLNALLPDPATQVFLDGVLTPIYKTLFRLLSTISGPLILLSVMWGVYGIGDTTMLGKIGKRMIFTYIGIVFAVAALATVTLPLFGNTFTSGSAETSQLSTIFDMILNIVPSNIVEPFSNGNTLQIIFVAFVIGIAMLFLGKKVTVVAEVIEQINFIVQFLMDLIGKLIPFFIFVIIVRMILSGTFKTLTSLWKLVIVFVCAVIVLSAVTTLITCGKFKVSPKTILRKSLPTFLISITTASSAAAFGSNMETCDKRFGIENSLSSFGIPLGMVMCKPATVIYYLTMSFFFCNFFGVECSFSWMIMAVIVSALLAVATPPIPGGGAVAYTVLFSQLGIPEEALAIALSIDILFDFVRTATNMYNLPVILMNIANTVGMHDVEILKKDR